MKDRDSSRHITIIGAGHVGLVSAACFAEMGHQVCCIDSDLERIRRLEEGEMPFFEPGMSELVLKGVHEGRLTFTTSYDVGLAQAEFIFIAVGTPTTPVGLPDL